MNIDDTRASRLGEIFAMLCVLDKKGKQGKNLKKYVYNVAKSPLSYMPKFIGAYEGKKFPKAVCKDLQKAIQTELADYAEEYGEIPATLTSEESAQFYAGYYRKTEECWAPPGKNPDTDDAELDEDVEEDFDEDDEE